MHKNELVGILKSNKVLVTKRNVKRNFNQSVGMKEDFVQYMEHGFLAK